MIADSFVEHTPAAIAGEKVIGVGTVLSSNAESAAGVSRLNP